MRAKVGVVRQAESAALKAAGLTESGKKSGTFKRELTAVFSQVRCIPVFLCSSAEWLEDIHDLKGYWFLVQGTVMRGTVVVSSPLLSSERL